MIVLIETPKMEKKMAVAADPAEKFQSYAHPDRLVSTDWLAEHLDDPSVVIVESDEDVLLYHTGHIPNAIKIDWVADLNDPLMRDYLDAEQFAALMSRHGITPDSTVVFYGDNFNWWAAYALWVFELFGHVDTRLLDGGRAKWVAEGREMTTEEHQARASRLSGAGSQRSSDPGVYGRCAAALEGREAAHRCALTRRVPG